MTNRKSFGSAGRLPEFDFESGRVGGWERIEGEVGPTPRMGQRPISIYLI